MQIDVVTEVSDIDGLRLGLIPVRKEGIQGSQSNVASPSQTISLTVEVVLYTIENLHRLGVRGRRRIKAS